jgi:GT2 family glycosyltransferase/glycosyltransferase involved in cell wall biosynthesis
MPSNKKRERVSKFKEWLSRKNRERLAKRHASRHPKGPELCEGINFKEIVDPASINLRSSNAPEVSIIIPGYGKADYTLRCLKSLAVGAATCSYEVLVVEDASGDPSAEQLRKVNGITLIWNSENLGFLRSCNKAANQARGQFVYFLNNDTVLLPGALDTLLETAKANPDAGIVGSKLIYPNGCLQEAGGIIWSNGDAANYGRNQDPREPRYNYLREADYISGASILLRRDLWNEMDGFDERYAPAYYEDSDLSIRLQKAGHVTLYEPRSVVVHCEGVSNGTSTDHGIKAYQVINRDKFLAAHEDYLRQSKGHSGDLSYRSVDAMRKREGMVLIVDHYLPEPDVDAGSRNILEYVRTLQALNYVVKFWPQNLVGTPKYVHMLEHMGVETFRGPYQQSFEKWVASHGKDITHVLLSRPTVAPFYFDAVRRYTNAQVIYYGHDLHYARMLMEAKVKQDPAIADSGEKMRTTEMGIWSKSDLVLYPSQEEVDAILKLSPRTNAAFVPPFQFDTFKVKSQPHPGSKILFVAGFQHSPNVDAAKWLITEVMPLVWESRPDAQVYLVGSKPTDEVLALAAPDRVMVTGSVTVEVLDQHYATARVSVVPLRFGAGVKLKVVETMQSGVPLVTTTVGLQGLPDISGTLQPHDTPPQVASELLALLGSDELWMQRSSSQTRYVRSNFSTTQMQQRFLDLLSNLSDQTDHDGVMSGAAEAPRIIDGFTFYNEVDMLELRLRYLSPHVDQFLIVEADRKFSGEAKPFLLKELLATSRFAWVADKVKIRSVHIDTSQMQLDTRPEQYDPTTDFWKIEATQRNAIRPESMDANDILLMGDVDEIPNIETLKQLRHNRQFRHWVQKEPRAFRQSFFYYNPHCLKAEPWAGTIVIGSEAAASMSNQEIRSKRYKWKPLENGGWHFSYFMSPEQIADKIKSFSHQEYNTEYIRDANRIRAMIDQKRDIFEREEAFVPFETGTLPSELRALLSTLYPYFGPL